MSLFGVIYLHCPRCSKRIAYNEDKAYRFRDLGVCCSQACHDDLEKQWAISVLGQDEEEPPLLRHFRKIMYDVTELVTEGKPDTKRERMNQLMEQMLDKI